jgi:hypothetical protein
MIQSRLPTSPAVRELVPRLGPSRGVRAGALPPASCAVTRDQLYRHGAMGRCGMHDGRSTGATAIREDPVRLASLPLGRSVDLRPSQRCGELLITAVRCGLRDAQ